MQVLKDWFNERWGPQRPALSQMRLCSPDSDQNPLMIQFFTWDSGLEDMSWWKHLEIESDTLSSKFGVSQVWLPPPSKAAKPSGQGYDAYDLWDLGEFSQKGTVATRWGTKEELLAACETARKNKIEIIIDTVLNHKMGADHSEIFSAVPVDPQNRLKDIGPVREVEGWTKFDFNERNLQVLLPSEYSSFRWDQRHFTGVDWDQKSRTKGIYRITGDGHKGWSTFVDKELGNYDYLLGSDIDHRHPEVRNDLLAWGKWVLDTTGGTGVRLDAIKHYDHTFALEFIRNLRGQPGRELLFSVAEYWSSNVKLFLPYIYAFQGQTAFFDVPLHYNFHRASEEGSGYDLRRIFKGTLVQIYFDSPSQGTYPANSLLPIEQVGQSLESWVGEGFKTQAYAFILLRPSGHPCVFYGDLYQNRECYNAKIASELTLLLDIRKNYAYGNIEDFSANRNCVGFVRSGDKAHPAGCAVVISNAVERTSETSLVQSIKMRVGAVHAGASYRACLGSSEQVRIDGKGWGKFTCRPNSVQVWVPDKK